MNGRKTGNTGGDESDRKHLTGREVERLIEATKGSRNEARDRCLLLLMFRHGLRVSEACGLKLDQVDTESRVLHVARLKGGLSTTQPLRADELRAVSAWLKERARMKPTGKAFFVSEQRQPLHLRICCATLAASPWPTRARIQGSFKTILDTGTFSTLSSTPRRTRHGSKNCGGERSIPCRYSFDDEGELTPAFSKPIILYDLEP